MSHSPTQKITVRQTIACPRCLGEGVVFHYDPDDIFRQEEPEEEVCPACQGSGLVKQTITTFTVLTPFSPQKKQLNGCRNCHQTACKSDCGKDKKSFGNDQEKTPSKHD